MKPTDGVIVAADQTLEWMLPWWLKRYREHNDASVAFIDLGLSHEKKKWCKEAASLIPLRMVDFAEKAPKHLYEKWIEESGSQFLSSRNAWFKKPFACLKSPFERTLWIDVDCEIRGSLTPLYEYANDFGMAIDQSSKTPYPMFNSGVIAFSKEHPLLKKWAEQCLEKNQFFRGDQELFSHMVYEERISIEELPPIYNWSRLNKERSDAVIQHWHGNHGKFVIRCQMDRL